SPDLPLKVRHNGSDLALGGVDGTKTKVAMALTILAVVTWADRDLAAPSSSPNFWFCTKAVDQRFAAGHGRPPVATAADGPPAWTYTPNNPDYKPPVDDGKLVRAPDSTAGYTWSQLRDRFIAPVWHPSDHGGLPDIVANGRKPGVFACGFCHRATG